MRKRVKLTVLGFSFNQTQSGTYGLVLGEDDGVRRLVIIIGTPEAQSIAFKLHKTKPPRPLTHDLFQTLLTKLEIPLKEVVIYRYNDGVFYSRLVFVNHEGNIVSINSRTSDAIAIAIRTNSPIYTTENIMKELSVVFTDNADESEEPLISDLNEEPLIEANDYTVFNDIELKDMLVNAIESEEYELASLIQEEINKRAKSQNKDV